MGIAVIILFVMLGAAGVLCALLSAIVCGVIAHFRNLSVVRFSCMGALYGVFILPWTFLVARMFNRHPVLPLLALVYLLAYALWLGFAAGVIGSVMWPWEYRAGGGIFQNPERGIALAPLIAMSVLSAALVATCLFTMGLSLRGVYYRHREDRQRPDRAQTPSMGYLAPYLYAYLWFFVGGMALAFAVASFAVSNGIDIQGF